eukprot:5862431-Amphidinium_carterae.1
MPRLRGHGHYFCALVAALVLSVTMVTIAAWCLVNSFYVVEPVVQSSSSITLVPVAVKALMEESVTPTIGLSLDGDDMAFDFHSMFAHTLASSNTTGYVSNPEQTIDRNCAGEATHGLIAVELIGALVPEFVTVTNCAHHQDNSLDYAVLQDDFDYPNTELSDVIAIQSVIAVDCNTPQETVPEFVTVAVLNARRTPSIMMSSRLTLTIPKRS